MSNCESGSINQPGVAAEAQKLERLTQGSLDHSDGATQALHAELNQLAKEDPNFVKSVNAQLQTDRNNNPNLPNIEISYHGESGSGGIIPEIGKHVDITATQGSGSSETGLRGSSDHSFGGGGMPPIKEGGVSETQPNKPINLSPAGPFRY